MGKVGRPAGGAPETRVRALQRRRTCPVDPQDRVDVAAVGLNQLDDERVALVANAVADGHRLVRLYVNDGRSLLGSTR